MQRSSHGIRVFKTSKARNDPSDETRRSVRETLHGPHVIGPILLTGKSAGSPTLCLPVGRQGRGASFVCMRWWTPENTWRSEMKGSRVFEQVFNQKELRIFARLDSPPKIQTFSINFPTVVKWSTVVPALSYASGKPIVRRSPVCCSGPPAVGVPATHC